MDGLSFKSTIYTADEKDTNDTRVHLFLLNDPLIFPIFISFRLSWLNASNE